jgi:hypothetical protein
VEKFTVIYPINQWVREGDFYKLTSEVSRPRIVIFKNYSMHLVNIKKISIQSKVTKGEADDWKYVTIIRPSPSFKEQFSQLLPLYFGNTFRINSRGDGEIKITKDFLSHLKLFIQYLRASGIDEEQQFPKALRLEIETIVGFINGGFDNEHDQCQHNLPERPNPARLFNSNSLNPQLIRILEKLIKDNEALHTKPDKLAESHRDTLAQCQHLLAKGENPNQFDARGIRVLNLVVLTRNKNLAKLFLAYGDGAMPFFPNEGDLHTPFEVALKEKIPCMLELFTAQLSPLQKSLPVQKMIGFGMLEQHNTLTSLFRFSDDNFLFCTLKNTKDLTTAERLELYALYGSCFGDQNDAARNDLFAAAESKLITLIRNQSTKIVGTVVYNIKMIENVIWIVVDLELFHAQHANYGMMPVITYSVPYSLQLLFPDIPSYIVFFSATQASFNRIKHELAYPKYQTEGMTEQILTALENFSYEFKFYTDDVSFFYVVEKNSSLIKDTTPLPPNDCDAYLYERLRGKKEDSPAKASPENEVLVSVPVAFEFVKTLQRISIRRNIPVLQIICTLAEKLRSTNILRGLFPETSISSDQKIVPNFASSSQLFWNKRTLPAPLSAYKELEMPAPMPEYFKSKL